MRIDRKFAALLSCSRSPSALRSRSPVAVGGDGETVKISDEAQKKTQDMLGDMQKKMQDLHKADKKGARRGP